MRKALAKHRLYAIVHYSIAVFILPVMVPCLVSGVPLLSPSAEAQPGEPLVLLDVRDSEPGGIPDSWHHVQPENVVASTHYDVVRGVRTRYLRLTASGSNTWIEYPLDGIDAREYPVMEWEWKVDRYPETRWEMNEEDNDFAIRVECVYDFEGGKNAINILRKGLINTIFRGYPPELIVSYVWSVGVPPDKMYESPDSERMQVLPIESGMSGIDLWLTERRRLMDDIRTALPGKSIDNLRLKKIRVRADTDETGSNSESGITHIRLLPAEPHPESK